MIRFTFSQLHPKKFLNIIQEIKTDHDNDPNANARLYRLPKMPDP